MQNPIYTTEVTAFLDDVDRWVISTKATSGQLGQMVLNHGGFIPLLRKRGTLKPETRTKMLQFMASFPNREALPPALIARLIAEARACPWDLSRNRALLIRCGYPDHMCLGGASGAGSSRALDVVDIQAEDLGRSDPRGADRRP